MHREPSGDHHRSSTGFQLHLVTDRAARQDLAPVVGSALRGGLDCVQVREKKGPASRLYETVLSLLPPALESGASLLVNDRLDVALACGADGVHLPGAGLPPEAARALLGPGPLVGVSVHGLEEARAAVEAGADYVTFGHVHPTASKPGSPPAGIRKLAKVVEGIEAPVLATGASGAAVISAILAAENPESATLRLREAIEDSRYLPRYALPARDTAPHPNPHEGGS